MAHATDAEGRDPRWTAQHEAGHASVSWALGMPLDWVALDPPRGPLTKLVAGTFAAAGVGMTIAAAGVLAEHHLRGIPILDEDVLWVVQGSPGDRPYSKGSIVAPDQDMAIWTRKCARWRPAVVLDVWHACEKFAAECRPAIDVVAARLLERRELTGTEVAELASAAMPVKPAPHRWTGLASPGERGIR